MCPFRSSLTSPVAVYASNATGPQPHDWLDYVTAFGTLGAALAALLAVAVAITIQRRTLRAEGRRQAAFEISVWLQGAVDLLQMWHDPAGYRLVRMSPVEREYATDEQALPDVDALDDTILEEEHQAEPTRRWSWLGELRLRAHLLLDETRWRMTSRSARADTDANTWDPTNLDPDDADVFAVPYSHGTMAPRIDAVVAQFSTIRGRARLAFGPRHEVTGLVEDVIEAIQRAKDHGPIGTDTYRPADYVNKTLVPIADEVFEALARSCELRPGTTRARRRHKRVRPEDNLPRETDA